MIRAYAGIAQLVEHLIRNEGVAGSSPVSGTINKKHRHLPVFFLLYTIQTCYLCLDSIFALYL